MLPRENRATYEKFLFVCVWFCFLKHLEIYELLANLVLATGTSVRLSYILPFPFMLDEINYS